jgi:hypothetical protein
MKTVLRILLLLLLVLPMRAQTLGDGNIWRYQLTDGAAIMDDCPSCDRVSIWEPLAGSFDLIGTTTAGEYIVTNIAFHTTTGLDRSVWGAGTLSYATSDPILTLDVGIFVFDAGEKIHLTNAPAESPRIFPMIGAQANEDPGSITRVYRLRIQAAPIRELWFSTAISLTSSNMGVVSHGDLLSNSGLVVKRNAELTERLSVPEGDVGLDAIDIGPRGEIFFSTTSNVESVVNGPISHSDIVTSAGRIYLQTAQLLAPFGVNDPEAGLDALHIKSDDEIYFSISKDIPRTGATTLHRGDILSSKGRIIRTEANLFSRWTSSAAGIGVDALYVWPNGEIWFSTENDFTSSGGIPVSAGDIISDQGYVAFRNSVLTGPFNPTDAIADFGLDALVIISDAAANTAPTRIVEFAPVDGGFDVRWESAARIFQVERAATITGPWATVTGLTLEQTAHDDFIGPAAFYRIRQW